jgi:hypothetical protein
VDAGAPVDVALLESNAMRGLRRSAVAYVRRAFGRHALWGFGIHALFACPFWLDVFAACPVDDTYLLVIRNPMSVAKSLFARRQMPLSRHCNSGWRTAYRSSTAGPQGHDCRRLRPLHDGTAARLERNRLRPRYHAARGELAPEIDRFTNEFATRSFATPSFDRGHILDGRRTTNARYAPCSSISPATSDGPIAFWAQWQLRPNAIL